MNDVTDLTIPHTCTGQFIVDFTEICKRLQPPPIYIPQVVSRPHRPSSPPIQPVVDEKPGKVGKAGKKDDPKNIPVPENSELEIPSSNDCGGIY